MIDLFFWRISVFPVFPVFPVFHMFPMFHVFHVFPSGLLLFNIWYLSYLIPIVSVCNFLLAWHWYIVSNAEKREVAGFALSVISGLGHISVAQSVPPVPPLNRQPRRGLLPDIVVEIPVEWVKGHGTENEAQPMKLCRWQTKKQTNRQTDKQTNKWDWNNIICLSIMQWIG